MIGSDFICYVLSFFESDCLPSGVNKTWVTLIAKFDSANKIKDFRSISMISCIYKVIAKILANRLRTVMNGLVGETQTAFIQGRQILDGTLISCEVVHWLKKHKKEAVLVKLDFCKAYDLVRWVFVDHVL